MALSRGISIINVLISMLQISTYTVARVVGLNTLLLHRNKTEGKSSDLNSEICVPVIWVYVTKSDRLNAVDREQKTHILLLNVIIYMRCKYTRVCV